MNDRPDFDLLYDTAEGQAGYFTARQAREAGFSFERLSYYAGTGRFLRAHHGIYRLAHFPASPYEDLFVAWLRTGPHSVISHESALYLYGLSDVLPDKVDVIIPRSASRRRDGIRLHTHQIGQEEITQREGLPVTSPARTIIDVAASGMAEEQIYQAVQEALVAGITDADELCKQAIKRGGRARRIMTQILEQVAE